MRLRRLDLTRYGHFTDRVLDFGEATPGGTDFHVVYGLNEAGKSTTLSAYLDLIFGIEHSSTYGFLHPYPTMEIGGVVDLAEGLAELRRTKQRVNSLRRASGEVVSEGIFGSALAGLTRDQYRMMFCLNDETLEAGGEAILESKGDVGQLLFAASAGLSDLTRELAAIDAETDTLFRKRASTTTVAQLKQLLVDLKARRDQLDIRASAYVALKERRDDARQSYSALSAERSRLRQLEADNRRRLQAIPLVQRIERLEAEIEGYGDLPRLAADLGTRINDLRTAEATLATRLAAASSQIDAATSQLSELSVDELVLARADAIRALATSVGQYQSAALDLPKRRDTLMGFHQEIADHLRRLGFDAETAVTDVLIPHPVIQRIRELLTRQGGLRAAVEAAQDELAKAIAARGAFERGRTTRADAGSPLEPSTALAIAESLRAIRESDSATRLKLTSDRLVIERAKLERLLEQGERAGADLAELRRFSCPPEETLDRWARALGDIERRRQALGALLKDRQRERAEWMARIASVRERAGRVDDTSAATVRRDRDTALATLLKRLDRDSADAFVAKLREDDAVSDLRLALATEVALLRQYAEQIASIDAAEDADKTALAELASEEAQLAVEMTATAPVGLIEEQGAPATARLERLRAFVSYRADVLEIDEQVTALDAERTVLASDVESHRARLTDRLQRAGVTIDDNELGALIAIAEHELKRSEELIRTARKDEADALALAEAVVGRQGQLDGAKAAIAQWQGDWTNAIARTWLDPAVDDPAIVAPMLDQVAALSELVGKTDDLNRRIRAMENDQSDLKARLAEVLTQLNKSAEVRDPIAAVTSLIADLEHTQKAATTRSTLNDALRRYQGDLDKARQGQGELNQNIAAVLALTGAASLDEAASLATKCAERDRLEKERKEAIKLSLNDLQLSSFDEARQISAGFDREALQQDLDALEAQLEALKPSLEDAFAKLSGADQEIEAIGGDDAVARLETQRRTVLLELEQAALRYARLKAGSLVASRAIRSYRDTHRTGMLAKATDAFAAMTCGAYPSLATRPEKDREVLIGLPKTGGARKASDMSKGTRFQLYLALRLAAYHEAAELRPPVPIIADDIMETFDEPRSEAVMRLLGDASRKGQVIYLTHHRHLCDIAQTEVPGVKLHQL